MNERHIFSRFFNQLTKERNDIFCMAKLLPKNSLLETRLYVDDNGTYKGGGHGKRIKFQHDKDIVDGRKWCPMDFEGNIHNPGNKFKIKISQHEQDEISNFVKNNVYALNALCDIMDFDIDCFKEVMIPGGEPATAEQIEEQKIKTDKIIKELE